LVVGRKEDMARGFDGPRRAVMLAQLSFLHCSGLLDPDELDRFSADTREMIGSLAKGE
jgi:hypothetical protein